VGDQSRRLRLGASITIPSVATTPRRRPTTQATRCYIAVDAPQRLVVPTRHLEPVARSLANGAQPSGIVVDAAATRNAPEPMKGLER
jgi:hypothetical protein